MSTLRSVVVCLLVLASAAAGGTIIGHAVSQGRMEIDKTPVTGDANIEDGAVLRTDSLPGRVFFRNGGHAALAASSQARVHADRMELTAGSGTADSAGGLRILAGNYAVQAQSGSQAHVHVQAAAVLVAAINGPVSVRDREGALLARVVPGRPLTFEPVAGPPTSSVSGRLERRDGVLVLRDELTSLDFELRGKDLDPLVGKRIEAAGPVQSPASAARQQILVSRSFVLPETEPPTTDRVAGKEKDQPASVPAAKPQRRSGISRGAKVGIGVLSAGAAAGIVSMAAISR